MRTIIFFRHGKSDWGADYDDDFDRPLKKRGEKAACLMGKFLKRVNQVPDRVVTSPAVRARTTALLAIEAGDWGVPVREASSLYESGPDRVLAEIRTEPDQTGTLLIVGHEPTWSEMIGGLVGQANLRFPTAAMARVDLDVTSWSEVAYGAGTLIWLLPPKLLEDVME